MRSPLNWTLVVGLATAALWWVWPDDASRVRARLAELADAASAPPGEAAVARVARVAALARGLSDDVVVQFGEDRPPIGGRDAVIGFAARAGEVSGGVTLEIEHTEVALSQDGSRAVATVVLIARRPDRIEEHPIGQEVRIELHRRDGEWVVDRIEPIDVLLRP